MRKLSIDSPAQLGWLVVVEELTTPNVERRVFLVAEVEERENCWMTLFFKYLIEGRLPPDKALVKKVKLKSP